ncbi:group II intron reverse transcriptase/maturase [Roseofilum reptotaenium AO1-A]|uniref:Group II intron reverse transcriptase/maturase n=1 Tax=Roseofilum reptotaenium AO1-A TaxID=1925591 RepID=A0A1L9QK15_9CYAN|nr:reverse transcriptase domain-containing protein [Roseofilum reptotaenium]OJJ15485.1 group II intron reverse transcriptase/maturase [Roseofilum reptotaenium AO1-A]
MEPEWEAKFEPNSYGFRPGRSAHDAIVAIYLAINKKTKWVLDADIAKCFDKINHDKLLQKLGTYPKLRQQIKAWLKSGVIQGNSWFPTKEGTPQGGVISPLLANIALHGMEEAVKQFAASFPGNKRDNKLSLSLIRYADDFVILHKEQKVIEECKKIISDWLADMGLELKSSKTQITHTLKSDKGFNFLGFNIRQYPIGKHHRGRAGLDFKNLIKPQKEKVKAHIKQIGDTIAKHKSSPQAALIKELNPIIQGWSNYNSTQVSKEIFVYCDYILFHQLIRWAKRRHPNKGAKWVVNKYWHTEGKRKWVFGVKKDDSLLRLTKHSDTPIIRHTKVKGARSPYDGDLIYWSSRLGIHPEMPGEKAALLKNQEGKCNYCGHYFKDGDILEIDHVIPKALGGNNRKDNKQLLHRHCHDRKTAVDLIGIRDKNHSTEEPDEVKVSRPVLKTSQRGDSLA